MSSFDFSTSLLSDAPHDVTRIAGAGVRRRTLQRCCTLLNSFLMLTIAVCGVAGPLVTSNVAYTPHIIDMIGPSGVSSYQLIDVGRATWTAFAYSDHFEVLNTTRGEGEVVTSPSSYNSLDPIYLPFSCRYSVFINITDFNYGWNGVSPNQGNKTELSAPECATLTIYRVSLIVLLVTWFFVVIILIPVSLMPTDAPSVEPVVASAVQPPPEGEGVQETLAVEEAVVEADDSGRHCAFAFAAMANGLAALSIVVGISCLWGWKRGHSFDRAEMLPMGIAVTGMGIGGVLSVLVVLSLECWEVKRWWSDEEEQAGQGQVEGGERRVTELMPIPARLVRLVDDEQNNEQ